MARLRMVMMTMSIVTNTMMIMMTMRMTVMIMVMMIMMTMRMMMVICFRMTTLLNMTGKRFSGSEDICHCYSNAAVRAKVLVNKLQPHLRQLDRLQQLRPKNLTQAAHHAQSVHLAHLAQWLLRRLLSPLHLHPGQLCVGDATVLLKCPNAVKALQCLQVTEALGGPTMAVDTAMATAI
jgi:hypothetical protein